MNCITIFWSWMKKKKEFLDEIRTRNGNLTIICGRVEKPQEEL